MRKLEDEIRPITPLNGVIVGLFGAFTAIISDNYIHESAILFTAIIIIIILTILFFRKSLLDIGSGCFFLTYSLLNIFIILKFHMYLRDINPIAIAIIVLFEIIAYFCGVMISFGRVRF